MPEEFQTVLLEGVFYRGETGELAVQPSHGGIPALVWPELKRLVDLPVQLSVHHLPPHPPNPKLWGGGCCMWEPSGHCPFGHHKDPTRLLNLVVKGILEFQDPENAWAVTPPEGNPYQLPLWALEGHRARIVGATVVDLERMKEALSGSLNVEELTQRATGLRDLMASLSKMAGEEQ